MELAGFADVTNILRAGVYALVCRGEVVYVGKSKMMLGRVYTHRSITRRGTAQVPSWIPVKGIRFDEVFVLPCAIDVIDAIEREMINRYKPKYNLALKTAENVATPITIQVNGKSIVLNAHVKPKGIERRL